jgi:predicted RNA-binding Zn-ribbon protein involved in translation (DUF1610 family)
MYIRRIRAVFATQTAVIKTLTKETYMSKACPKCGTPLAIRSSREGATFYSCPARDGNTFTCNYTETINVKTADNEMKSRPDGVHDSFAPTTVDITDQVARLADLVQHSHQLGLQQLEEMATRFITIGPAMEALAMAAAIPGFGKVADELTDEDREARATYFAQRTAGLGIGQPLPYDKTKAQA